MGNPHFFLKSTWARCLGGCLLLASLTLAGCGGEPFHHVKISGTVKYDDGELIPVSMMELTFQPLAEAKDAQTHPRPGHASVDVSTGKFDSVTSHKQGDGVVAGKHKVKITAYDESQQISKAIPKEYTETTTTPLIFDTNETTVWTIKIKRPGT